jgi:hypothetical protein
MSKLLVKRNRPNIYRLVGVIFYPGITEVIDPVKISALKNHPAYKEQLALGVMTEVTSPSLNKEKDSGPTDTGTTADIADMSVKDALSVIRETYAIQVLQDMHQRETNNRSRRNILSAIMDQIDELKKPPKKKAGGSEAEE